MPLIATEGDSKPRQLPPEGTHVARCISVIDLGTQHTSYDKDVRQIRVTWELPDELAVFKEEEGPQPFVVNKQYTLSLFKKASLRQELESWRGKAFTPEELQGFDIFTLIGAPCLVGVVHRTNETGKTYANVTNVSKIPKGTAVPKQVNPSVQFSIDDPVDGAFKNFPAWLQEKIQGCAEWNGAAGDKHPDDSTPVDDEIPF